MVKNVCSLRLCVIFHFSFPRFKRKLRPLTMIPWKVMSFIKKENIKKVLNISKILDYGSAWLSQYYSFHTRQRSSLRSRLWMSGFSLPLKPVFNATQVHHQCITLFVVVFGKLDFDSTKGQVTKTRQVIDAWCILHIHFIRICPLLTWLHRASSLRHQQCASVLFFFLIQVCKRSHLFSSSSHCILLTSFFLRFSIFVFSRLEVQLFNFVPCLAEDFAPCFFCQWKTFPP